MKSILAWHFLDKNGLARGVKPPHDNEPWIYDVKISLCESGLHASKNIRDALSYAPGPIVCRVECSGEVVKGDDKIVCTERTILWRYDASDALRKYARMCALDVAHLWDMPNIVKQYLLDGDELIRDAAAAWAADAAWDAAGDAAWDAAGAAAAAAAAAGAWDAAWAAARKTQSRRLVQMIVKNRPEAKNGRE